MLNMHMTILDLAEVTISLRGIPFFLMLSSGSPASAQPALVETGTLSTTIAEVWGEMSESVLAKLAALCTA